jgi:hypothetical protein
MGGSSKPQTTNTVTEPWSEQRPFLISGFQRAEDLYQQGAPEYYPGQLIAGQSPMTTQAAQNISNLNTNNPALQAATNQAVSTLQGDYLNSNPWLDATYNRAADQVINRYNEIENPGIESQFSRAGRLGQNAAFATVRNRSDANAATQLQDLATQIYGGNYARERQNQLSAIGQIPGLNQTQLANINALQGAGQINEAYNQDLINAEIQKYNYEQQAPRNNLADYLGFIQGNYGGSSTATQPIYRNKASGALGGALSGAAAGSAFGPYGAAIGGGIGLIGGLM